MIANGMIEDARKTVGVVCGTLKNVYECRWEGITWEQVQNIESSLEGELTIDDNEVAVVEVYVRRKDGAYSLTVKMREV